MPQSGRRPFRVCLLATPVGDDADRALDGLLDAVAEQIPHEAKRAWISSEDTTPSFADLQQADVAIVCARRMPLAGEALARVQWYCQRGRPLIALCAGGSTTFARWPQFDHSFLGIESLGTITGDQRPVRVTRSVESHPIVAEFQPFTASCSLPQDVRLLDDAQILLEGSAGDQPQPLAWTRRRGSARMFATALGRPQDLTVAAFVQLIGNAIRWVTHV